MSQRLLASRRAFEALERGYLDLLFACDRLEGLSIRLNDDIDPIECRHVLDHLRTSAQNAHQLEDLCLIPALKFEAAQSKLYDRFLARISAEHCQDACHFEELDEALESFACQCPILDLEATRYMCLAYVRSLRRHIAAERLVAHTIVSSYCQGAQGLEPWGQ